MNTNIPLYRAKKIDSGEYIEGFYVYDEVHKRHLILTNEMHGLSETRIDSSTLSIHFPDMLDNDGNKVFASLSEDGKGGDEAITRDYPSIKSVVAYDEGCINVIGVGRVSSRFCSYRKQGIKITGIKL